MKKLKKNAAKFRQLDAAQMDKIKGGIWIEVKDKDGNIIYIEV